jgi:hypothetical protein
MIRFISGLDFFLPSFLLRSLQTSISEFTIPTSIVCPSNQVTFQEVTVDPYLKVLTKNYYYLLSLEMTSVKECRLITRTLPELRPALQT